MNKLKNRVIWIDILKIIACFFVIINHSGGYIFEYTSYNKFSVLFYSINFAICKVAVLIFLMITGYLLLQKESTYKQSFKRIFRVLVPLLALSLVIYVKQCGFHVKHFIYSFFNEPIIKPFWYLYMLCGLYLMIPFMSKVIKVLKENDLRNLIIICLIIPGLIPVIGILFHININSNFTLSLISYPIVFALAGVYLSKVELNKKNRNIAFLCFIIPILFFILSMYLPFLKTQKISYALDTFSITSNLPALSLFYLIRYFFSNKESSKNFKSIISTISSVTFGIYLFHFSMIGILSKVEFIQQIFKFNPYIGIIIFQLICFVICGIITYIMKKIPVIKKFL